MLDPNATDKEAEQQFCRAKMLLSELLELPWIKKELEGDVPSPASRVYTQAPTLWLLTLQRLGKGLTLEQAVKELIEKHRDILPENRRVTEGKLSENNSAYNKARKRMPLKVIENFSQTICNHLASLAPKSFDDRRVFILDGTTITLPPTPELKKAFPPSTNKHGQSVWPVARLLVANEMETGCALVPQIDPMYGPDNRGETQQALVAIDALPPDSIVMADSGFGIFSVAYQCQQREKRFLFRLTKQRFKAHLKQATLVEEGPTHRTYHRLWKPSSQELRNNPHLPKDAVMEVLIHQVDLDNGTTLDLVSDLQTDALSDAQLYQRRYDVEFDIRDFKVTMDSENIRAKSVDTTKKELLGSVIAYNLVAQFRKQAAKLAGVAPRRLSFSGVWTSFRYGLLQKDIATLYEGRLAYHRALLSASGRLLPNRKAPRSYPRAAHPRRQKSTKFQKEQRKAKAAQSDKQDKPKQNKDAPPD